MRNYIVTYNNPDTDGVACALSLSRLYPGFEPVITGRLSSETEYVLHSIGLEKPVELSDYNLAEELIVVDTHHKSQLGEHFPFEKVCLVIDHHPGGDDELFSNATIDNRKIGAAASIVGEMLIEAGLMDSTYAQLLQYAIVSNTLNFKAPSTSPFDKEIFDKLAEFYKLDSTSIDKMLKCPRINSEDVDLLITDDVKIFDTPVGKIAISQIESANANFDVDRIKMELNKKYGDGKYMYSIFNGVNIDDNSSVVVFSEGISDDEIKLIFGFDSKNGCYKTNEILLRKTNFIPQISNFYKI